MHYIELHHFLGHQLPLLHRPRVPSLLREPLYHRTSLHPLGLHRLTSPRCAHTLKYLWRLSFFPRNNLLNQEKR